VKRKKTQDVVIRYEQRTQKDIGWLLVGVSLADTVLVSLNLSYGSNESHVSAVASSIS
jgi:hypothetical protein